MRDLPAQSLCAHPLCGSTLAPMLLYGMTLLVDIVMLNALIAIMGDT
jgi:hypothetical protein